MSSNIQSIPETKKVGRPRKYHTEEEYKAARKQYYNKRKIKQMAQTMLRESIDSKKSDAQREIEQMLLNSIYPEDKMMLVLEIIKQLPNPNPCDTDSVSTQEEVQEQSDK